MPVVGCVKLPTVVVHPTWRSPWQPVKETRSLHCLISHLKLNTSRYLSIEHLAFSHRRCGWCLGAAPPGRYNSALSLSLSLSLVFPLNCLELIRIGLRIGQGRLDGRESIKDRCLR